jgi:hypothetical protein
MMTFKVECWEDAKSGYDTAIKINPDYIWSVMKFKTWWPLPWPYVEIGVVMNLRKAEEFAAARAIYHAKILHKKVPTKIIRVLELNGRKTNEVIWDNGKLVARDLWPWWRWLLMWTTGYAKSWGQKDDGKDQDQKTGSRAGVAHSKKARPISKR